MMNIINLCATFYKNRAFLSSIFIQGALVVIFFVPRTALERFPTKDLDVDIAHTSISDLMNMDFTSVSKTEESRHHAPAATYVLSNLGHFQTNKMELSLAGRNLSSGTHYQRTPETSTAVEPGVYGRILWTF